MKTNFKIAGYMKKYLPEGQYELELPAGATMADWYEAFAEAYSDRLTKTVWNAEKHRFYRPVRVTINDSRSKVGDEYVLQENDVVVVSMILIGG